MTSFSIVIPVYNAEANLQALYERFIKDVQETSNEFEVVLVEDHSQDNSWEIIKLLSEMDVRVKGIRLCRNFGQHNALLCGIRAAKFGTIVTMDDDL